MTVTPARWAAIAGRIGGAGLALGVFVAGCDSVLLLYGLPEPKVAVQGRLPVELPYREGKGGIVILSGRVNGKADVDFVLDTGAPVTVLIDNDRTAELGFDTSRARRLGPPDDPAAPIGVVQNGVALTLGDVALSQVFAVVLPEKSLACPERYRAMGFAGVIGADLFRRFVVEVDPAAKRVRLHDPATWKRPGGTVVVPISFDNGHPFVAAKVTLPSGESIETPMHLDTGMNTALSLTADSHPALSTLPDGEVSMSCFVSGMREVRSGAPLTVELAGATFRSVAPSYSFKRQVPALQARGAIGSGLLSGRGYTLDYANRILVLTSPDS